MARDRRLNREQRTVGELRRAIRKAGGDERLEAGMHQDQGIPMPIPLTAGSVGSK